jgi:hypothetical protein
MASQTPEPNQNSKPLADDQLPPLPEREKVGADVVDVADDVGYGKGGQPTWYKIWINLLAVWSLWFIFIGAQGLYRVDNAVIYFFTVVIIVWTVYHLLAPRFKWPALPLG